MKKENITSFVGIFGEILLIKKFIIYGREDMVNFKEEIKNLEVNITFNIPEAYFESDRHVNVILKFIDPFEETVR